MRILSIGIIKGVKFNFFFDDASKLLLLVLVSVRLSLRSFFLLWDSTPLSFFHLFVNPFTISVSSPFMYFCALNSKSVIDVEGVFPREKTRSGLISLAWKVVIITCSLASSISRTALLNCFTYSLRVFPSYCFIVSRLEVGLL